ncbi:MAG: hypothetical protein ACOZBH_03380 [Patescibacteria group bacterium]
MENLKKLFTFGVVLATIVWAMGVATFVPVASAAVIEPGDVIKGSFDAVYFYASDGKRYVYPQDKYYFTWQYDFSGVMTITDGELADIPLAGNVVTRYGTKLIKILSIPSVYAVSREGTLYRVPDQATAESMFGTAWGGRVMDVQDGFWPNYTDTGMALDGTWYPDGFLLKAATSSDVYFIWDGMKSLIPSEDAFYANRFMWEYVTVTTQAVLDSYTDGPVLSGADSMLLDDSQGGGGAVPVPGEGTLNVTLSSSTPASQTAPRGATGVEVAKYNFTAGADAGITLNSLTIHRTGLGDPQEISKLYLYNGSSKLTSGKTISTSTNNALFANLNWYVGPGQTGTLTLVADVSSTYTATNGSHQFEIVNANAVDSTAESVMGNFPVMSNTLNISTVTTGSVDLESSSNTYTRKVGEKGVEVGRFTTYVNNTEDAHFAGVTIYNAGRDIYDNMKIYRGSDLASTCSESGDYFVCSMSTPWPIQKGDSASFTAKADVTGRDGDQGKLYVRYNTDVRVTGDTYGFNMAVDGTLGGSATDSYVDEAASAASGTLQFDQTTVEAGQVTFTFNGPSSADVSKNTSDIVLMNFSVTAGSNIDVEKTVINLSDSATNLAAADMDDLELVCDGLIVASDSTPAVGDNSFTDTWSLTAGHTTECQVRVDLTNAPTGNENIKATLKNPSANWTFKDADSGDTVTDIVPSGDIAGNEMDITVASLTIDVASTPATGATYVTGSTNVDAVGFTFQAGTATDVKVNSVKLAAYLDDDTDTFGDASDFNQLSGAKDVIVKVTIYDADAPATPLASSKGLTLGTADITVQFDSLNWTIPAGTTKKLLVVVDISTTAPKSANDDYFALAIDSVDAEYGTGTSLTPSYTDDNTAPNIYQVVTTAGTLDMVIDADTPNSALLVSGTSNNAATKVKFNSTKEAFTVEKLRIFQNAAGGNDEVASVTLEYENSLGATESVTQPLDFTNGTANFTNLDIYVPKDGSATAMVYVKLNTTTGGADDGDDIILSAEDGSVAGTFRAVGVGSSTVITQTLSGDQDGNTHYVYEAYPAITFASDTPSGNFVPSANTLVAKIKVTATGGKDITFDGPTAPNSADPDDEFVISVSASRSDNDGVAETWVLKDGSGNQLDSIAVDIIGDGNNEVIFDFNDKDFVVPAGQTKYLYVYTNTLDLETVGDSIQIWLDDAPTSAGNWSINYNAADWANWDIIFRGDIFGGALVKP